METKARGILLFAIVLIYYILLNIFSKQVSPTTQIIINIIWVIIFWTLIFWISRNVAFFKKISSKFTGFGSSFKYAGYLLSLISVINAVIALFKYEGSKAWIVFWVYILFALIFILMFYWLGLCIMKIEKNVWFSRRAIELKTGLIIGIVLAVIFFLASSIDPLVSPESFQKISTSYLGEMVFMTIYMFIIGFIIGIIIGLISRIFTKFFTGTSKLFKKK